MRSNLRQRLEATRAGVVSRIQDVDRATLNRPRADGGWSAFQVLHHVIAAESGTLRYISKKMLAGTRLPGAGLVSRLRWSGSWHVPEPARGSGARPQGSSSGAVGYSSAQVRTTLAASPERRAAKPFS
jgi:hypothetical protein